MHAVLPLALGSNERRKKGGYTHSQRQIGKSTYPDDSIQLAHCHLLGSLNSLSHLLLMLQDTNTKIRFLMETDSLKTYRHMPAGTQV